ALRRSESRAQEGRGQDRDLRRHERRGSLGTVQRREGYRTTAEEDFVTMEGPRSENFRPPGRAANASGQFAEEDFVIDVRSSQLSAFSSQPDSTPRPPAES